MFKNLKYASFILLVGCIAINNQEKIYTDLIPTIRNKGEGSIASIQEKNLLITGSFYLVAEAKKVLLAISSRESSEIV